MYKLKLADEMIAIWREVIVGGRRSNTMFTTEPENGMPGML